MNSGSVLFLYACAAAAGLASPSPATENAVVLESSGHTLNLAIGAGEVSYQEDISIEPIASDWTSDYLRFDFAWTYAYAPRIDFRVDTFLWTSSDGQETWRNGGRVQQVNDLEMDGMGLRGACGYGLVRRDGVDLTAWLGLGFRSQDFDRSGFVVEGERVGGAYASIGESYDLFHLSVGAEAWFDLTQELRGGAGLAAGPFIYSEAANDLFGAIEGSGGYLVEGRVSLELVLAPRHAVVVSAVYEEQTLEGDVVSGPEGALLEWPENTTETWGIELAWTYRM